MIVAEKSGRRKRNVVTDCRAIVTSPADRMSASPDPARDPAMTVTELHSALTADATAGLHLMLPTGEFVPAHFHVTEVGRVQKDFVDCGGTRRSAVTCLLQVWVADDTDHRLTASKLAGILAMAGPVLRSGDLPVEVEYEGEAVSQYPVAAAEVTPRGVLLHLGTKHTDCLAKDLCGVPAAGATAGACGTAGCC